MTGRPERERKSSPSAPPAKRRVVLQAAGVGRIGRAGGNAAVGRATADGDAIARARRDPPDPVEHRAARAAEAVEQARAVRPAQDRALDAEKVERRCAAGDRFEDRQHLFAGLLAQRGVPDEIDAERLELAEPAGRAVLDRRHGAAPAGTRLQPHHGESFPRVPSLPHRLAALVDRPARRCASTWRRLSNERAASPRNRRSPRPTPNAPHPTSPRNSLNACGDQPLRATPGMHHSMHNGSIARAASSAPISAVSQPNSSNSVVTARLAAS